MNDFTHALIDTPYLTIYDPTSRPLVFVALELLFLACAALTLAHVARGLREGDGSRLFAWSCTFMYGLVMELVSYNALDNFTHGQFTVMFYHHKLPLYVVVLYPVFIYTAIYTVARLRLSAWAEPFVVGLAILMMDFPFDILGPDAGWWSWSPVDPVLAYRWHGVPVTSYYWHLTWGGMLSVILRRLRNFSRDTGVIGFASAWKVLLALPLSLLNVFLGAIVFLPYHGLKALGVADGLTVGALIGFSLLVFLGTRKEVADPPDPLLRWIPTLYFPFFAVVSIAFFLQGVRPDWGGKLAVIGGVMTFALLLQGLAHRSFVRTSSA